MKVKETERRQIYRVSLHSQDDRDIIEYLKPLSKHMRHDVFVGAIRLYRKGIAMAPRDTLPANNIGQEQPEAHAPLNVEAMFAKSKP